VLLTAERATYSQDQPEPKRVGQVDLHRYAALWYEITRIPNSFQKQCARGVTAEYTLRDDGEIDVVNRCYKEDGRLDEAEGLARIEDKKTNSQLKVSFFSIFGWRPIWGDYWIIDLANDYSYATVCSPDRKYGWILARERKLPDDVLDGIFTRISRQGFKPDVFKLTDQEPPS